MMSKANIRFDKSLYDCASFTINTQVLEKAYKLDCDVCRSKSNKNCSQNPRCLNGLGEKTWLNDEIDDQLLNGNKDPNSERRVLSSFVGLKNLGATCYVNSLLQVWYHNPILREAIYKWCPDFDPIELSHQEHLLNTCNNEDIDYVPITAIAKLQLIFAFMQFGLRRFVDPSPIIKCLELDESQQQDAHEFSNLFISLIEKKLAFQRDNTINKIIENQYCGKCAYITRCQTCGESSRNESRFYELDLNIKGCKDIFDCLDQYLKEENLEGNNQYYCGKCKSKQNAIRFIQLEKLPPVLTLQLLRFVYDPQKGGKKKLNSFLRFPDTLLMTPFIKSFSPNTKAEMTYHLSAVLIHRGPSAHSGHYIAHIKDNKTCSWYKFNDEKVEKIEGHKLKLDSDDGNDETCNAENIADKSKDKGWHCSNNAYMLVYKNETQQTPDLADNYEAWNVPKYLRKIIDDDNIKFEQFVSELEVQRNLSICENKRHQQEVKNTYKSLLAVPNSPYEFISKAWLTNWLSCQHYNSLQPVDNTQILCEHGNLNAVALSSFKCISAYGADIIYEKYGGGPRLDKNSLCRTCICQQANISQIKSEIEKDQKIISSQLKYTLSPDEECYWVGKQSLRNWKNIRLKSVSIECNDNATENNFSDNSSVSKCDNFTFESNGSKFNNEIICIHGQLSPKESNRRLVASLIWQVFKKHFPDAPQFSKDSDICLKCISMEEQLESLKIQNKGIANEQKNNLPNLYNGRQRLCWEELTCDTPYYVLSKKFHKIWKNFINDPSKYEPPNEIENLDLFCAHHLFLYPPKQIDLLDDKSKFIVITNDEWVKLTDYYSFDFSIKISVCNQNGNTLIESNPSHCVSCHQSLILEEERNRLTYTNQHIYIRRIENIESLSDSACDKKDETSDNYQRLNKKQKTEDLTLSGSVRRSSRRRKNKNETEIKVSSTDTLKDLKVQIMKIFKVATYDQQLYLNDTLLTNTEKTLAQLHIEPQSIIILKVDEEPSGDCSIIEDDYIKGSTPEIGFKAALVWPGAPDTSVHGKSSSGAAIIGISGGQGVVNTSPLSGPNSGRSTSPNSGLVHWVSVMADHAHIPSPAHSAQHADTAAVHYMWNGAIEPKLSSENQHNSLGKSPNNIDEGRSGSGGLESSPSLHHNLYGSHASINRAHHNNSPPSGHQMLVVPQPVKSSNTLSNTPTTNGTGRKYQCKMCPQIFGSKADMQLHTQIHMREAKPYKCSQCSKAFANSSYLSQHTRIHLGIKPYRCEICQRKFTQLSHLQQHIRTHTGDKPYKCRHPSCNKAFSQLSNLQSHSRCHQTDKPYKCNSCYKCFTDEASLLEHIPKHKESKHLKTHICQYCGKSYTQETYLAKHMQKHADRLEKRSGLLRAAHSANEPYWSKSAAASASGPQSTPTDCSSDLPPHLHHHHHHHHHHQAEQSCLGSGLNPEQSSTSSRYSRSELDQSRLSGHHLSGSTSNGRPSDELLYNIDPKTTTSVSASAFTPIQSTGVLSGSTAARSAVAAAYFPYESFGFATKAASGMTGMDVKSAMDVSKSSSGHTSFPNQLIALHQIRNYASMPSAASAISGEHPIALKDKQS